MRKVLSAAIYSFSALIGAAAFLYPFFLPEIAASHEQDAPLLTIVLVLACLGVLLIEVQGQAVSARMVAALGILVAVTAILRFLETAIPGPAGFSPIFAPIILAGYVFGARFGFLMGTMTLLVSALITGGVGPWLPYQMFTAGWVGLTAGWLPQVNRPGLAVALLALFGFFWGLLFGLIMNLFTWPFIFSDPATSWEAGLGFRAAVGRYLAFYVATTLIWDLARAFGNALLILILGRPAVRALSRFRDRFQFSLEDGPAVAAS